LKILISATYFEPYKSGLSIYALRVAQGLAKLGHEVVVLTSQFTPDLPLEEDIDGVKVVRIPVLLRISKGVIPRGLRTALRHWVGWADVVNLHLPQFESPTFARECRRQAKPLVVTYHCDLEMSAGLLNRLAGWGTQQRQTGVLRRADFIVQNSLDYAEHSPWLKPHIEKVREVPTPIDWVRTSPQEIQAFRTKYGLQPDERILGLAGRVATEKGYEYLIEALPAVLAVYPQTRVAHAGTWKGVLGEEAYQAKIEALLQPFGEHWKPLGFLPDEEFRAFFGACDALIFSSLNRTESFGIVQIEAMLQGTPVIASDLPGVRQPVLNTGMGKIVPIRDADALTKAILATLDEGKSKLPNAETYLQRFAKEEVTLMYQALFKEVLH
jgi:glycosyltransferase involved in cell wall biosynthesis